MKHVTAFLLLSLTLTGCISTARLSDFSQTSSSINFNGLSKEFKLTKTPIWTSKTSNEYYFEKETDIDEAKLVEAIKKSLKTYGYAISVSNIQDDCIIGQRGMVANEWSSITAVYYKIEPHKLQVYINTKITQDFTGGWRENRSMKVGQLIEQTING
ncbi:MAG TPA: hypothetical protein VL093_05130 [Flavipsychrobacter sp.]|nr:hypothetical protein [Flavipsychrobacter sp.]